MSVCSSSTRRTLRIGPWLTANRTTRPTLIATRATRSSTVVSNTTCFTPARLPAGGSNSSLRTPLPSSDTLGVEHDPHLHVGAGIRRVAQVTHGAREDDLGTRDAVLLHEPHVLDRAARRVRAGRTPSDVTAPSTLAESGYDAHWSSQRRRVVARVAFGGRRDVARKLPHRDHVVVAAGADAEDLRVIHATHGRESDDAVAVLAEVGRGMWPPAYRTPACRCGSRSSRSRCPRGRMPRARKPRSGGSRRIGCWSEGGPGLAERAAIVVTARAASEHFDVIHGDHGHPTRGPVARVAQLGRRDVLHRLRGRPRARALRMTAAAPHGRAGELAVDVTALARRELVRAVQAKRRGEVIEDRPGRAARRGAGKSTASSARRAPIDTQRRSSSEPTYEKSFACCASVIVFQIGERLRAVAGAAFGAELALMRVVAPMACAQSSRPPPSSRGLIRRGGDRCRTRLRGARP